MVNAETITELVNEFESYKTPGPDNIYPIMLKSVMDIIAPRLTIIVKFSLSTGLVPSCLLESKVIFIPKPGKND